VGGGLLLVLYAVRLGAILRSNLVCFSLLMNGDGRHLRFMLAPLKLRGGSDCSLPKSSITNTN